MRELRPGAPLINELNDFPYSPPQFVDSPAAQAAARGRARERVVLRRGMLLCSDRRGNVEGVAHGESPPPAKFFTVLKAELTRLRALGSTQQATAD